MFNLQHMRQKRGIIRWVESPAKLRRNSKFQQLLPFSLPLPRGMQKSGNCCNLISLATSDPAGPSLYFVSPYLETCSRRHKPDLLEYYRAHCKNGGILQKEISVSASEKSFPEFLPPGNTVTLVTFQIVKAHKLFYWKCE